MLKPLIKKARRRHDLDVSWQVAFAVGALTVLRMVRSVAAEEYEVFEVEKLNNNLLALAESFLNDLGIEVKDHDQQKNNS